MTNFRSLSFLLLAMIETTAFAAPLPRSGTVVMIDPIVVREPQAGVVQTYSISGEAFVLEAQGSWIRLGRATRGSVAKSAETLGTLDKPFSIRVESGGTRYLLTVPARRTLLFADQADGYIIEVKDRRLGGIVADVGASSLEGDAVRAEYQALRESAAGSMDGIQQKVDQKEFAAARGAYSRLVSFHELFSADLERLDRIFQSMPEEQRPLRTYRGDLRPLIDRLVREFRGTDFDSMTVAEFGLFVDGWAGAPAKVDRRIGAEQRATLFWLLDQVGVPADYQDALLIKAVETRLEKFVALAKSGADPKDAFSDDRHSARTALELLRDGTSERGKSYYEELKKRVAAEEQVVQAFVKKALSL